MSNAAVRRLRSGHRLPFVATALLLGCAAAAVLVEVGFRSFWVLPPMFAEFQQAGMYVGAADGEPMLRPGYRGSLRIGDDRTTTVAINSLGLRGAEPAPRTAATRRLLVGGDSLVFGYGVEAEEALPACLERALRRRGLAVTAGNAGVPGYGATHSVRHLRRLDPDFQADAFLLCGYLGNDAIDDTAPRRVVYAGLMLSGAMAHLVQTSWRARLAMRSRAALWVEGWILANRPAWSPLAGYRPDPAELDLQAGLPPEGQRHAGLFLDVVDADHRFVAGGPAVIDRLSGLLGAAVQSARELAGERPLWFVILPTIWQVDPGRWRDRLAQLGFRPADFERGTAQRRWRRVAESAGVTVLDATPVLAASGADPAELFLADGGHLSARGNEVVAEWLVGELGAGLR